MALLNEILIARFNQLLTRLCLVQGGSPAPQLTPEIGANFDLSHPEDAAAALMSVKFAAGSVNVTNVALKQCVVRLRNPANSGTIITVRRIICSTTNATGETFEAGVSMTGVNATSDLAQNPAAGGVAWRDTRIGGNPAAKMTFDQGPASFAAASLFFTDVATLVRMEYELPVILGPGTAMDVFGSNPNVTCRFAISWEERPGAPGEVVAL